MLSHGGRPCPVAACAVLHLFLLHVTSPVIWVGNGTSLLLQTAWKRQQLTLVIAAVALTVLGEFFA